MNNLNKKAFALVIFTAYIICFSALALHEGKSPADLWAMVKIGYHSIPLVLVLVGFFVGYAWKWRVFRGWLVPFPDLNGTWQGMLQSTWIDPQTQQRIAPIPIIVTIRQTFIHLSCVVRTAESSSHSFIADFWLDAANQVRKLSYSYQNQPKPTVVNRSPPHSGTALFEIIGTPVTKLKGTYWTERKTTGEMELVFRQRELLEEFPNDLGPHPNGAKLSRVISARGRARRPSDDADV
jgi:hypothetical protein